MPDWGKILEWEAKKSIVAAIIATILIVVVAMLGIFNTSTTMNGVFALFAVFYMRDRLTLNHLWAACCLVGAVFFMFRK